MSKRKTSTRRTSKSISVTHPERLSIGVFQGATDSVLKLDLTFLNIKISNVNSRAFRTWVRSSIPTARKEDDFFVRIKPYVDTYTDWPSKGRVDTYAITAIDFDKSILEIDIFQIQNYLNLIQPSRFRLVEMISYVRDQKRRKYSFRLSFQFDSYNSHNPILDLNGADFNKMSEFIKLSVLKLKAKEFEIATLNFFNSFAQNEIVMAFINNVTALEALTSSGHEITYQVSRMCAVLNSDTKEEGQIIFKNMKKFYGLRSTILHGGNYDHKMVEHYFAPLTALVSQTLSQLILMKKIEAFSDFLNQSGYGERIHFEYETAVRSVNDTTRSLIVKQLDKPS